MASGLDRDDTVVRRRLRQKLEFLAEDTFDALSPTDGELHAWLAASPEKFRTDPEVSFRQVYVSLDRGGDRARRDVEALLTRLTAGGADVAIDGLGDRLPLPRDIALSPRREVSNLLANASLTPSSKPQPAGGLVRSSPGTACTSCSFASASPAACRRSTTCARSSNASSRASAGHAH